MSFWHFYLKDGTPVLRCADDGFTIEVPQTAEEEPMRRNQFLGQYMDSIMADFTRHLMEREPADRDRTERQWWQEFVAFVGLRQNFPYVPLVPTEVERDSRR